MLQNIQNLAKPILNGFQALAQQCKVLGSVPETPDPQISLRSMWCMSYTWEMHVISVVCANFPSIAHQGEEIQIGVVVSNYSKVS